MPGATLVTVNAIMKEVYEGQINDQLQSASITSKRFEKSSEGVFEDMIGGKYVTFPVRHTRNHGISYRPEGGAMAAAGQQGYSAATETLKYGYQRVYLTGQVMELAEKNYQAFASALDREISGAKSDVGRDVNRITYGHVGSTVATGILSIITANSAGTTLTVASGDTQYIEIGMVIDVSAAGTPVAGGTAVKVVSKTLTTIVVDVAVTGAVIGNVVTRTGNYANEPMGLSRIIDSTGNVHGLDPATAPYWASQEDAATTTLTELAMIQMSDNIFTNAGKRPSAIFCSFGVRRAYWNLLTALRRYNEPKNWTGGLVGLAFNDGEKEIPVVSDPDCPFKHMFYVNESEFKIYRSKPWYWDDTSGNVFKWVSGFDAHEAYLKQYWQQGTHQRNAHGKFTNLTES